jgi:hypothetical protein
LAIGTNIHLAAWARDFWEKIVEAPQGLRVTYPTRKAAIASRFALYTARNMNRKEMEEMGLTSPWDAYRLTIEVDPKSKGDDGKAPWVLVIALHTSAQFTPLNVEEI